MSIFLLVLANLSLFYVLGPVMYMATHRQTTIRTRRISPAEAPDGVARAIVEWREAFGDAHFPLFAVQQILPPQDAVQAPGPSAHVLHFVDRAAGVHGLDYVTSAGRWQVFLTRFGDGEEVVTTNYPRPLVFILHPREHVARVPDVAKLAWLHTLHVAHVAHAAGGRQDAAIPGDELLVDFVANHELRRLEHQRELGAMARTKGVYRPTWRGAFYGIWSYLPPLRWINRSRERRLARALHDALR